MRFCKVRAAKPWFKPCLVRVIKNLWVFKTPCASRTGVSVPHVWENAQIEGMIYLTEGSEATKLWDRDIAGAVSAGASSNTPSHTARSYTQEALKEGCGYGILSCALEHALAT
jgi:hypothetical protein